MVSSATIGLVAEFKDPVAVVTSARKTEHDKNGEQEPGVQPGRSRLSQTLASNSKEGARHSEWSLHCWCLGTSSLISRTC